jgi:methanethiol S-methyltransferase
MIWVRLILLWSGWCLLHSLTIARPIHRWRDRRGGLLASCWRLGYNLIATLTLLPLLWYTNQLEQRVLFTWTGGWSWLQGLLLLYSLILFLGGLMAYDLSYVLGLRQWREYRRQGQVQEPAFQDTGVLAWVRHPWYSAGLALLWTLGPVTTVNLISRSILSLYLLIGCRLEELRLRQQLGPCYVDYCRRVPRLLPRPPGRESR